MSWESRIGGDKLGKTTCLRFTVPDAVTSLAIPAGIQWVIVRNATTGLVPPDIRINFDSDTASNYATLSAGSPWTPPFRVGAARTLNTDGVGGSGIMEVIGWS